MDDRVGSLSELGDSGEGGDGVRDGVVSGGIGRSGSSASLGDASYKEVSYAMAARSISRAMMMKSSNNKCSFDGTLAIIMNEHRGAIFG